MNANALVEFAVEHYEWKIRQNDKNISDAKLIRKCLHTLKKDFQNNSDIFKKALTLADKYEFSESKNSEIINCTYDLRFWAYISSWTPQEAACLALDIDPDQRDPSKFPVDTSNLPDVQSRKFQKLKTASERYLESENDASPSQLYKYLLRFDANFNPNLEKLLRENDNWHSRYEKKYRNTRRTLIEDGNHRDTILKIIFACCNFRLGYSSKNNNQATSKIIEEARISRLKLRPQDVRDVLKAAEDRISELGNISKKKIRPKPNR